MQKIAIIGFGFTGTACAIHLIEKSRKPLEIIIIENRQVLNTGIAYNSYSEKHLLNVKASKMSIFPSSPNHFVQWIINKGIFPQNNEEEISEKFVSRNLFGKYLNETWMLFQEKASKKNISIKIEAGTAEDIIAVDGKLKILLNNNHSVIADKCIIATGNQLPADIDIKNKSIFTSGKYFKNPWDISSVKNLKNNLPILIVGNGLTMVDKVIGLLEHGVTQKIISLSRHGFNILPHKKFSNNYNDFIIEWNALEEKSLFRLICLFNRHLKILKQNGQASEALVDSLRFYSQEIWKNFNVEEKKKFMNRVRHLWGVVRHRIPLESYEVIASMRRENRLEIIAGKISDVVLHNDYLQVEYIKKNSQNKDHLDVCRIINCTGPQTDISNSENILLQNLFKKGWISQDALKLGINANSNNFRITDSAGVENPQIFTLAGNLKGMLWETTAVNEIRMQALRLTELLDC